MLWVLVLTACITDICVDDEYVYLFETYHECIMYPINIDVSHRDCEFMDPNGYGIGVWIVDEDYVHGGS